MVSKKEVAIGLGRIRFVLGIIFGKLCNFVALDLARDHFAEELGERNDVLLNAR